MRTSHNSYDLCGCGASKDTRAEKCWTCHSTPGEMKPCSGCGRDLPLSEFHRRSNGRLISRCKECRARELNEYRLKRPRGSRARFRVPPAAVEADPNP